MEKTALEKIGAMCEVHSKHDSDISMDLKVLMKDRSISCNKGSEDAASAETDASEEAEGVSDNDGGDNVKDAGDANDADDTGKEKDATPLDELEELRVKLKTLQTQHQMEKDRLQHKNEQLEMQLSTVRLEMNNTESIRQYAEVVHKTRSHHCGPFPFEADDSPCITDLQSQLVKSMHDSQILESRLNVVAESSEAVIQSLQEELAEVTEERNETEVKLMKELFELDQKKQVIEESLKEEREKNEKLQVFIEEFQPKDSASMEEEEFERKLEEEREKNQKLQLALEEYRSNENRTVEEESEKRLNEEREKNKKLELALKESQARADMIEQEKNMNEIEYQQKIDEQTSVIKSMFQKEVAEYQAKLGRVSSTRKLSSGRSTRSMASSRRNLVSRDNAECHNGRVISVRLDETEEKVADDSSSDGSSMFSNSNVRNVSIRTDNMSKISPTRSFEADNSILPEYWSKSERVGEKQALQ